MQIKDVVGQGLVRAGFSSCQRLLDRLGCFIAINFQFSEVNKTLETYEHNPHHGYTYAINNVLPYEQSV